MARTLTEEEAKQEVDDINAEIARSKGLNPDGTPIKPATTEEIVEVEEEEEEEEPDDKELPDKEDNPEDEGEDEDPKPKSRHIPLSKFQEFKKTQRELQAQKDAEITRLNDELNKAKTVTQVTDKVKAYAEKHNMPEEQVLDLVQLMKGESALDPKTLDVIKKSQQNLEKQEALEHFENEFEGLIEESPEASNAKNILMKEAFKPENLNKSLYEVFHRFVKPNLTPKKKGGESSRGTSPKIIQSVTNFEKIAENLRNNVPNALGSLSGAEQDKFFDWMNQNGSRYSRGSK